MKLTPTTISEKAKLAIDNLLPSKSSRVYKKAYGEVMISGQKLCQFLFKKCSGCLF